MNEQYVTEDQVEVAEGKYTVILRSDGTSTALRYHEPWPAYAGETQLDNLTVALARDLIDARSKLSSEPLLTYTDPLRSGAAEGNEAEVAPPKQWENQYTFTVPDGYEAVRDAEGRATGEVRPVDPKPDPAIAEVVERNEAAMHSALEQLARANGLEAALIASNDRVAELERERDEARDSAKFWEDRENKALPRAEAAEAEVSRLKAGAVTDDALLVVLFLLDRIDDLERGWDDEEALREFFAMSRPRIAWLRSALSNQAGTSKTVEQSGWIADFLNRRTEVEHVLRAPTKIAKRNATRKDGKVEPLPDPLTPEQMWELANKLSVPSEFGTAKTKASK